MFCKFIVLLLALAASVAALNTHRSTHNHRALAKRVVDPSVRRRADGKRCRPRPSSTGSDTPVINVVATDSSSSSSTSQSAPTTSQPAPTTSQLPPPSPPAPTTQTLAATNPKPNTGGSLPSFMTGTQIGQGTYYSTGLGACGIVNTDADYIAAVSHLLFDTFPGYNGVNPNSNPICGRKVPVTYQGNNVTVTITDRCEGCALLDLDFSPAAFQELASLSVGRLFGISWHML